MNRMKIRFLIVFERQKVNLDTGDVYICFCRKISKQKKEQKKIMEKV
ncbi:unnamed protein product [Chironomus riparius]|uniref:Uncharacterized protein n=1 Tax=Chironomus riparius TaxID=315576 RepID=A0A9N9WUW2_9DIPT|nr:unnamed protein product [Chironomus riparius]